MHQWRLGENGLQVFLLITVDDTVGALTGTRQDTLSVPKPLQFPVT